MIVNNSTYKKSITEKLNLNFSNIYPVWPIEWNIFTATVSFRYDPRYTSPEPPPPILCDSRGSNLNWVWSTSNCRGRSAINKSGIRSDMDTTLSGWEGQLIVEKRIAVAAHSVRVKLCGWRVCNIRKLEGRVDGNSIETDRFIDLRWVIQLIQSGHGIKRRTNGNPYMSVSSRPTTNYFKGEISTVGI